MQILSLGQWRKIDLINFVPLSPGQISDKFCVPEQKLLLFSHVTYSAFVPQHFFIMWPPIFLFSLHLKICFAFLRHALGDGSLVNNISRILGIFQPSHRQTWYIPCGGQAIFFRVGAMEQCSIRKTLIYLMGGETQKCFMLVQWSNVPITLTRK